MPRSKKTAAPPTDPAAKSDPSTDAPRRRVPFLEVLVEPAGRSIVVQKQGHRLVYPCPAQGEAALLDRVADDARDPDHVLTWFDASLIAHRVGHKLTATLEPCEDDLIDPAEHAA